MVDVSIVIPALNEEKYIERTLKAVKAQKFSGSFEIIVADGLSSDATAAIAKKYADKVVFEKTRTIAAGRQHGIDCAKGKILAFTDADTLPSAFWLEKLCKPFSDKNVVCTYGEVTLYDGTWFENFLCKHLYPNYFRFADYFNLPAAAGSNMAVRADALKKVGGFKKNLAAGEDIELQKRLRHLGRLRFTSKAIVSVSSRRIRKWGFLKFIAYHIKNTFDINFRGKAASKEYEPIR